VKKLLIAMCLMAVSVYALNPLRLFHAVEAGLGGPSYPFAENVVRDWEFTHNAGYVPDTSASHKDAWVVGASYININGTNAWEFEGANEEYLSFGKVGILTNQQLFTFVSTFNCTNLASDAEAGFQIEGGGDVIMNYVLSGGGIIGCYIDATQICSDTTTELVTTGEWYQVVITRPERTNWNMYINGALHLATNNNANDFNNSPTYNTYVGMRDNFNANEMRGYISTWAMYDRGVDATAVSNYYFNQIAFTNDVVTELALTNVSMFSQDLSGYGGHLSPHSQNAPTMVYSNNTDLNWNCYSSSTAVANTYLTSTNGIESLTNSTEWSLSAWVKLGTTNGTHEILSITSNDNAAISCEFSVTEGYAQIHINNTGVVTTVRSNGSIPINAWRFVSASTDGSAWTLYISGTNSGLTVIQGSNDGRWADDLILATRQTLMARYDGSQGQSRLNGLLAKPRVYDRALGGSEHGDAYSSELSLGGF